MASLLIRREEHLTDPPVIKLECKGLELHTMTPWGRGTGGSRALGADAVIISYRHGLLRQRC